MVAHALLQAGRRPAYLIGGELRSTGRNADWGEGEWLVVEADESDRSMLALDVEVAVVTNIELDHHATYGSLAELARPSASSWPAPARVVGTARSCARCRDVGAPSTRATRPAPRRLAFDLAEPRGRAARVPGEHNARNAAAALEACGAGGRRARGGRRRRWRRSRARGAASSGWARPPAGAEVVDDYAHHPTEVAATIAAARSLAPAAASSPSSSPTCSPARRLWRAGFGAALRRRRRRRGPRGLSRARAGRRLPRRQRPDVAEAAADARPGPRSSGCATSHRRAGAARPGCGAGDLCLVMGAGDVHVLGRRLVGRSSGAPGGG